MEAFEELLEGARTMDEHFRTRRPSAISRSLLALLDIWNVNFFGARHAR